MSRFKFLTAVNKEYIREKGGLIFTNKLDFLYLLWYCVVLQEVQLMKNMIKELWRGNVMPPEDGRQNTPEMKQLLEYIGRHNDDLQKTMTDEQKAIFEKFNYCWSEYVSLSDEALFEYAFRLGARLMLESLAD
jgi:hypothetical protein